GSYAANPGPGLPTFPIDGHEGPRDLAHGSGVDLLAQDTERGAPRGVEAGRPRLGIIALPAPSEGVCRRRSCHPAGGELRPRPSHPALICGPDRATPRRGKTRFLAAGN